MFIFLQIINFTHGSLKDRVPRVADPCLNYKTYII